MSFFDSIGHRPQQMPQQQMTPQKGQQPMTREQMMQMQQQAIADVKKDPHGAIRNAGYNVPDSMDDPLQMAKYLLDSNQITGPRAMMARQLMARMGR